MDGPTPPPAGWPPKRVAALLLTLGLAAIGAWSLSQGILGALPLLVMGILLGATYVRRGGSLPDWAHRGRGSPSITRDDDPSNLPATVYPPILLGVLLLAALLFFSLLKRP